MHCITPYFCAGLFSLSFARFHRFELIPSPALSALLHMHMSTAFCWTAIVWYKWERYDKCDFPSFTPIIATDSSSVAITFVICISFWPHYFHVALSYRIWCMATTANHRLSSMPNTAWMSSRLFMMPSRTRHQYSCCFRRRLRSVVKLYVLIQSAPGEFDNPIIGLQAILDSPDD